MDGLPLAPGLAPDRPAGQRLLRVLAAVLAYRALLTALLAAWLHVWPVQAPARGDELGMPHAFPFVPVCLRACVPSSRSGQQRDERIDVE